jgi:hypothetical protein
VVFYAVGSLLSGIIIGKTHYVFPMEITSPLIAVIGTVLFYTMDAGTSKAWYVGAQIVFGLGIGLGNQAPVTALQAFSKPSEVAVTIGIVFSRYLH